MKYIFVTYYTKEGKLEFSQEEWNRFEPNPQKPLIFHREDGPAIEFSIGIKEWLINGKYHREDGPAKELSNGTKLWYLNGVLHREDGPAQEHPDGSNYWYIDGEEYSELHFEQTIKEAKALPLELRLTDLRWWVRKLK